MRRVVNSGIAAFVLVSLSFLAAGSAAAEDAPKAEPKEATKADTPSVEKENKEIPGENSSAPKAGAAKGGPKFPLKSEFFDVVFDSTAPDDAWENNAIQQIELPPTADILDALQASSNEHLAKSVNPEIKFKDMMKTPEKLRGQVVQIRGLLEVVQKFPLPDNKSGVTELWRGQVSNISGYIYTFFSIEKPSADLIKKPVRLTGIFLKRYAYKNRLEGEKLTWTPAVFVKYVEPFSENDVYQGKSQMSGVTALIIGVIVVLLMARIGYRYIGVKNKGGVNKFTQMKREKGIAPPGKFPRPAKYTTVPTRPVNPAPPAPPTAPPEAPAPDTPKPESGS